MLLDSYLPFFWLNSTHKLPWVSLANLVESWVTSITQLWSWLMASSETHNGLTHSRTKTNYVAAVVAHTYRHGTKLKLFEESRCLLLFVLWNLNRWFLRLRPWSAALTLLFLFFDRLHFSNCRPVEPISHFCCLVWWGLSPFWAFFQYLGSL